MKHSNKDKHLSTKSADAPSRRLVTRKVGLEAGTLGSRRVRGSKLQGVLMLLATFLGETRKALRASFRSRKFVGSQNRLRRVP
jgi:hypothetical protein